MQNLKPGVDPRVVEELKKYEGELVGHIPLEIIRLVEIPRASPASLKKLAELPDLSSMVADALDEFGIDSAIPGSTIAPLAPGQRVVGQALTSRHGPARKTAGHNIVSGHLPALGGMDKIVLAQPGDVMVIDARGCGPASNIGNLLAVAAIAKGLGGVVVDGYVRDVERMREMKLPVWSRGVTPRTGKYRMELIEYNGVVEIDGVQVRPGDVIVGDSDGIIVIPFDLVDEIAERTSVSAANEDKLVDALSKGASARESAEILPLNKW